MRPSARSDSSAATARRRSSHGSIVLTKIFVPFSKPAGVEMRYFSTTRHGMGHGAPGGR